MEKQNYRIFVGGIRGEADPNAVRQYFESKYSSISNISIPIQEKNKHLCKGFCVVSFHNQREYKAALNERDFWLEGRVVHSKPYFIGKDLIKFKKSLKEKRLFIKPIPTSWEASHLNQLFSLFGSIEDAYVIKNPDNGASKGYGFVLFEDEEDSANLLNNNIIKVYNYYIRIRKCENRKRRTNHVFKERKVLHITNFENLPYFLKHPSELLLNGNELEKIMNNPGSKVTDEQKVEKRKKK